MSALPPSRFFPSASSANPWGLVLLGGDLSPDWLLDAYQHGIFPWPLLDDCPEVQWWSPDPRAIFELDRFHISHRLADTLRSGKFKVTSDRDFAGVIHGCATADDRVGQTWLTPEMISAYQRLHELGHAHSVEVWHNEKLAGGVYGVTIGGLFAGESTFHYKRDASKVALAHLVRHLHNRGYMLFDIQQYTEHSASLGAIEIPRDDYLNRLAAAIDLPVTFGKIGAG